jgi:CDP-paratose synthetase
LRKAEILLTGSTGFLGSHLLFELVKTYNVNVLVRASSNLARLSHLNNQFNIYSIEEVDLGLLFEEKKFEIIIHTATAYGRKNETKEEIFQINYFIPNLLLDLSLKNGVRYFLNTDTFFNNNINFKNNLDYYVVSKKEFLSNAITKIPNQDLCFINLVIYQMYGPGDSKEKFTTYIINQILYNATELNLTSCEQTRDFIYVIDVVNAIAKILEQRDNLKDNFTNFNIGTGVAVPLKNMVILTKELCESEIQLNFGKLEQRDGEIMNSVADNQSLLQLGWLPKFTLQNGLKQTIQSIIKNNNN